MLDLVAVGAGVGNLVGTPVRALVGMAVGGMEVGGAVVTGVAPTVDFWVGAVVNVT